MKTYTAARFGDEITEMRGAMTLTEARAYAQSRSLWHGSVMVVLDGERNVVATYENGKRVTETA